MKPYPWFAVSVAIVLVFAGIVMARAKPPLITYAGGDGSSAEKAVIIKGAKGEEDGVHAEYDYLAKHFPGYRRGSQSLQSAKGRALDVLEFTTAKGEKQTIYFDISAFFGK